MSNPVSTLLVNAALMVLSCVVLIPIFTFFGECVVALTKRLHRPAAQVRDRSLFPAKLVILVPAHNEASVIRATLDSLMRQIRVHDRVIVIADNCTDQTAKIARFCGATVIERCEPDPTLRGKGYALDFGLRYIAKNPPDVVVTVDADCIVAPGTIARIARQAHQTQRPVQATYLMSPPEHASLKDYVSALAVVVKNQVRPLGLSRLGLPTLLTGSGMAFPWVVLQQISLAGSKTCDDMQTSIDLAIAGYPATYCPNTRVTGRLMEKQSAFKQRSRWEHGHLEMFTTQVPRLVTEAFKQKRFELFTLALEVAVPPLALLVMGWLAMAIIALINGLLTGFWLPKILIGSSGLMLTLAVVGSWWQFGRSYLSPLQLLGIPFYTLWKIPLYVGYLLKPQTRWLRTERD
ncbi:MAG: glycosyltransferase family 2 protein [Leptolyngbyaceae cyanobacterium bins.302]|nr:glycosyltransferase family 2 protein [Leptolyngbyaceae cyanobacterium bins.302]